MAFAEERLSCPEKFPRLNTRWAAFSTGCYSLFLWLRKRQQTILSLSFLLWEPKDNGRYLMMASMIRIINDKVYVGVHTRLWAWEPRTPKHKTRRETIRAVVWWMPGNSPVLKNVVFCGCGNPGLCGPEQLAGARVSGVQFRAFLLAVALFYWVLSTAAHHWSEWRQVTSCQVVSFPEIHQT